MIEFKRPGSSQLLRKSLALRRAAAQLSNRNIPQQHRLRNSVFTLSKCGRIGGGMGIRTPDLLIANETLYQLSYTPNVLI